MADATHIDILYEGVEAWNEWRRKNPGEKPNLVGEDLSEMDLTGVNLGEADLTDAELFQADLTEANLKMANMAKADLAGSNLSGALQGRPQRRMFDRSESHRSQPRCRRPQGR